LHRCDALTGWMRVRAVITKLEKVKKIPATRPEPSAANKANGKMILSMIVIFTSTAHHSY